MKGEPYMKKPNLSELWRSIKITTSKHSPEILTGIGVAGMIATTVLAVKATPKALELIEAKKKEDWVEKLGTVDTVKAAWKPYVPALVTGTASIACIVGASSVNAKRNAALAAAYTLSETALKDYRDKVVETVGEKKEQNIRDKVAKEQVEKCPVSQSEVVFTDKGKSLCFDPYSSRYFIGDIETIRRAANDLNEQMLNSITGYASLSDFYDEIGLTRTDISDDIGWNSSNLIKLDISSHVTDDGRPAIVVGHYNRAQYDYY
jgi:hypothetical protein